MTIDQMRRGFQFIVFICAVCVMSAPVLAQEAETQAQTGVPTAPNSSTSPDAPENTSDEGALDGSVEGETTPEELIVDGEADASDARLVPRLVDEIKKRVGGDDEPTLCDIKRQIVFGALDWDSAALMTDITRLLLEEGYGCRSRVERGSLHQHLNAMKKGELDIIMEVWPNQESVLWTALTKERVATVATTVYDDGVEGWFVPSYVVTGPLAQAPGLTSVFDLERFGSVFAEKDGERRGVFYNCVDTWGCADINTKKLRSYALLDDYDDYRPASGVEFFSLIEEHIQARKPVLFYMWAPSWLVGKYDLLKLEEPPYDGATWAAMLLSDRPERVSAYPRVRAELAVNTQFFEGAPVVSSVLSRMAFSERLLSKILSQMQREKLTMKETAKQFLKQNREIWHDWVSAPARENVEAFLRGEGGAS